MCFAHVRAHVVSRELHILRTLQPCRALNPVSLQEAMLRREVFEGKLAVALHWQQPTDPILRPRHRHRRVVLLHERIVPVLPALA